MALCSPNNVNAQGFLKKIKKAVEKELKVTSNEKQSSDEGNAAVQQPTDDTLKGLYHGNFGTDGSKETLVEIHETSATKKIILDKASGIRCGEFSCGLAFINTPKNGSFYINEQGDKVFSVSDKDIHNQNAMTNMRFNDNRVIDCIEKENGTYVYKAILYDNEGKIVKQLNNIEKASNFVNGVATVCTHPTKFGDKRFLKYINTKGEFVFPNLNIEGWSGDLVNRPLCDGLAAYQKRSDSNKMVWGFRDINGKEIVPATYLHVLDFSDGMAAVCGKVGEVEKWGFIDTTGKLIIPLTYAVQPKSFSDGYAVIENKEKEQFYIDKTGAIIKGPFKYGDDMSERISSFHNGYALLYQQEVGRGIGQTFVIDKNFNKTAYFDNFDASKESTEGNIIQSGTQGYFFNGGYIIGLDKFGDTRYTFISQKGDLAYDNLCSDFYEEKALYTTNLRTTAEKSSYINRKGEIIIQFVESSF